MASQASDTAYADLVRNGDLTKYMLLVGLTVLLYDHALTFRYEVQHIWRGRFGVVSAMFIANRYIVPWLLLVDGYEFFFLESSFRFCKIWTIFQAYLTVASYGCAHFLVAMRVYAIYGGARWMRISLWTAACIFVIVGLAIGTSGTLEVISTMVPQDGVCISSIPKYMWTAYLPSVLFESALFFLTVYAAISKMTARQDVSDLMLKLIRDGMLYFVAVSVCTLFGLITWAVAPPQYIALAHDLSLAMVNVAAFRLVLNLKVYASRSQDNQEGESFMLTPLPRPAMTPIYFKSGVYMKSTLKSTS
ncbi:hypothetical protein FIBSPDRAFT_1052678 [Athelia psychrophila]|uniref:DUF6533 domain-containing protein n=1 Tax=Athelia psychrophila TaxID=1759441 RepID=A0A165WVX6_9AGAM|nr:hypothetical protein FIBSPDRAFT_1052678 [Fibularhizoctonia sp. CBS 109695]